MNLKFKIGDNVIAKGKYYQSANGTLLGGEVEKLKGTIRKAASKGAHPYMLDTLFGWFDEKSLSEYKIPEVQVGDEVKLIRNENYSHKPIKLSLGNIYIVKEINDDKATIEKNNFVFVVNAYNLKKI